jgi:hypothetical protein
MGMKEREVLDLGAGVIRMSAADVRRRLAKLGRPLGPPWTQDQKLSALGAWTLLADPES